MSFVSPISYMTGSSVPYCLIPERALEGSSVLSSPRATFAHPLPSPLYPPYSVPVWLGVFEKAPVLRLLVLTLLIITHSSIN